MKYSVALVSAFAAVSLAGPLEGRQAKKPFVKDPSNRLWQKQCNNGPHSRQSEVCLGTRFYCKDKAYELEGEPFDSVQDCFRSREVPAFQEPAPVERHEDVCVGNAYAWNEMWRGTSEACIGTVEYCNQRIYEKDGEPFDNPKACIDSRKAAQSGANTDVSKGDDVRQTQAEFCTNNKLGLTQADCKIQVAQCAFDNQDATSFDTIAKCVESRV